MDTPTLLLIDVQREYFSPESPLRIPDGNAVLDRLSGLLSAARDAGVPVIHVQHHEDAASEVFATGTAAVETMEAVAPADGEPVVVKHLPGSFDGTTLDEELGKLGTRTLIIGGFMTHMCCDTTAREAAARGLDVVFLTDGTATRDLDGPSGGVLPHAVVHEATLAAQADGFSKLADVASVRQSLTDPS
ncbi:MAG: cysteine hydrolase family protein [Gaiellales bacterium]